MKDLISISQWGAARIQRVLELAVDLKRRPGEYRHALMGRTLVMLFEKPSLRTRVSFEAAMTQLGGHAIYYDLSTSPLGRGKETVEDTARVLSRYCDAIMARLFRHADIVALARHATIPVINGLTNDEHPTQILADLMTILEHKRRLRGLTLAYVGDGLNNVTHSLLLAAARMGLHMRVGCPDDPAYRPDPAVVARARRIARGTGVDITITEDASSAVRGADIVYTDSWMSYHIPPDQLEERRARFAAYQVTPALMRRARRGAIFLHCLPATRGYEVAAEVIDGPQSVVLDEAENRLHVHKAVLLHLVAGVETPWSRT
ncbi:MAG: ornithine carbamoyltransferase [Kiritimatiellae bacterium]|nr:ornithine carbamoyltransferase [Kiritimatiellia bacterium]